MEKPKKKVKGSRQEGGKGFKLLSDPSRRGFIKKIVIAGGALALSGSLIYRLIEQAYPSYIPSNLSDAADTYDVSKQAVSIDEAVLPLHPARYYSQIGNGIKCELCPNGCFLLPGQRGACRVRVNKDSVLYTLAYGNPCAVHVDPIEKKPMLHFIPATGVFSIATAGCNLRCIFCQNWQISQAKPEDTRNYDLPPADVLKWTVEKNCRSIAYTYTEPTIFYEYMLDTAKLAREQGVKNVWVTCGYINPEPLKEFCKYLDGANVDLKGFNGFYGTLNIGKLEPVLECMRILRGHNIWFEITNLIIPTYNDDMEKISEMCEWIKRELGTGYPLHFSRFFPAYKLANLYPTPVETLESARELALDLGIKYVYIGNVPGHEGANTYCPNCGKLLIQRRGYFVTQQNLNGGACKFCGEKIEGVWE
jgi:pyruvate formate lyase activating enzyme